MSRTAAIYALTWTVGATVEDYFDYVDSDGLAIDLTGFRARMHVRTLDGQYAIDPVNDAPVMALSTEGVDPWLSIVTPPGGTVPNRVKVTVPASEVWVLNPDNEKKAKLSYGLELYVPVGIDPEYVIPLVEGRVTVRGEVVR